MVKCNTSIIKPHQCIISHIYCLFERSLNGLNGGLPMKWPEKSFKENNILSFEKVVGNRGW